MVSTFSGLGATLSSLFAHRAAMDATGQNVANANTDGYSRQRVVMQSVGGNTVPAMFSTWTGVGAGVTVSSVQRYRDAFLDSQARIQHAQGSYLDGLNSVYGQIQQLLNEPTDTGIQSQLSAFWSSWQDVTNSPGDLAARSALVQTGVTLATGLNAAHQGLASMWSNVRDQLTSAVNEVNNLAGQVADLNQSVVRANQAGLPSNELADQRDRMVMRLSELTGAAAQPQTDGSLTVTIGGSALVSGATSRQLVVGGGQSLEQSSSVPVSLRWSDTGAGVAVSSGMVAARMETLNATVPGYSASFDQVAAVLAQTVNDQHQAGYDLNGNQGEPFFTGDSAASIAVAFRDPALVAASAQPGGNLDGGNADAIAGLAGISGGADLTYRNLVAGIGAAAQSTQQRASIQTTLVTNADAAVTGASGVNLDEEMTNLILYQRGYEAAARVMATVDSVLDTLINHTGVG